MLFFPCVAFAGTRYTYSTTTGDVTISQNSTSPNLAAGDTLDIQATASFGSVSFNGLNGSIVGNIVIRFLAGSVVTNAATFAAGAWTNVSFVKILNMNSPNFLGNPVWLRYTVHDIIFEGCSFINDYGGYSEKQAIRADDQNISTMRFDGTKATTFYNIEIKGCTFKGFKNVNVITVGSDTARSITTDLYVHDNYFLNLTSTGASVSVVEGTCFNYQIYNNRIDSIMATGTQSVHTSPFFLYGWGSIYNNFFSNQFANSARLNPIRWTGLTGYGDSATAKVLIYNNLDTNHLSFSFCEISNNNSGARFSNISGTDTAKTMVYFNTVYKTKRASYNDPVNGYHGCIVDMISHYVRIYNNVIISPEADFSYDPNAASSRYIIAYISGDQFGSDTAGNRQYQNPTTAGWNAITSQPIVNGAIYNSTASGVVAVTRDFFNKERILGRTNPGAVQGQIRQGYAPINVGSKRVIYH